MGADKDELPEGALFDPFRGVSWRRASLYEDAEWYDVDYVAYVGEQPFYRLLVDKYVPKGAAYVELGAGTGRLSIPFALSGVRVHGVEPGSGMRDILIERACALPDDAGLHTVEDAKGDSFWGPDDAPIGVVAFPFNGLLHIHGHDELSRVLSHVKARLAESGEGRGRFALDLTSPSWEAMARRRLPWGRVEERIHPGTGERVMTCDRVEYDDDTRVLKTVYRFVKPGEGEGAEVFIEQFMWTYQEVLHALEEAGFLIEMVFGDVDFSPWVEKSPRLLVSCC